ncbi:hypothetical protein DUNSADRAFT_1842 [Dunaliella salina]|uniref:MYND-type domain-containing protein n=1 Tax=Dunaliella salina TaxID=3046 RepID=A0ABQ7GWV7_DUNSA|nr:hypothetical protein DUNSADRAFT_1842 [Dunaliella salina]|eukprot:KAF5838977.1 hypothetical protein DUNSADRAFT_1842 [Dunaliella salina]
MATNKVAVTSVWDELTSKYNKAAEELGCTADFGKDPRLSQLTKVAFALATHTIPKRGVSAPGAREEKWEKRFKESLLVIQDIVGNSSSTPAGSWDETAKIWLTWGSSPFIAALQRYRVHLHRTPSPPERSFCQLFLAFINNAWRHELGHPNQSHGSVDFYLMLRSSEAWRNCPAWSPELLEAHLALLTQHPFLITSQPDSFVLYPPKQQLEAARHLAAHPFAVRALGLAAFSPSVTEFLRTQSDPAEALLFKPITPDVQAIMDLYSTVGSVLLFFCDLLRCSEGGSSHETLRKSVLPCLGDGMRNVMSMFLVVITKPSYPESSAPMLPNGFNMREWQAVALVALELDEADCPPDVRENVSYLKSFLRQESFLASGAGKLVKSKGLLWQADAASQQQAQPDRQQQAPAMPASNESNARSSSPKPGGSTSSTMADKLQALTLGNDGQKGNSSTAQSADSGSSGEIARGEAARRGKERVCGQCGRLARDLKMCSGCRRKWFCGAECSEKAWPVRRTDCKAAAKLKK